MGDLRRLNPGRCIQVIAIGEDGAREFCTSFLGVPPEQIDRVLDAGPNNRPEKYKPEAHEWHVFLTNSPKKPYRFRSRR